MFYAVIGQERPPWLSAFVRAFCRIEWRTNGAWMSARRSAARAAMNASGQGALRSLAVLMPWRAHRMDLPEPRHVTPQRQNVAGFAWPSRPCGDRGF